MLTVKPKLFVLTLLLLVSCRTTNKIVVGGDWIGYDYSYFCPCYRFGENGEKAEQLNIFGTNHLTLANVEYKHALSEARKFIEERGGKTFLDAVLFIDIDITFKDSVENFKNKRPLYDLDKCGQTKYYLRFLFKPCKKVEYRFGIALTDDYKVISKLQFPIEKNSPEFSKIISPTNALHIANNTHKNILRPLESIELIYDEQLNYFIWEIESEGKINNNPTVYETGFVEINATSGQITGSGIRKGRIIIQPSF